MTINCKSIYAIQPYEVGSKKGKSMAIVLPAQLVKQNRINTSTILALQTQSNSKTIILHLVNDIEQNKKITPAEDSLETVQ